MIGRGPCITGVAALLAGRWGGAHNDALQTSWLVQVSVRDSNHFFSGNDTLVGVVSKLP